MLVADWKTIFKYWSVKIQLFAVAVFSIIILIPDIWLNLPPELKVLIPENISHYFSIAVAVITVIARITKQKDV